MPLSKGEPGFRITGKKGFHITFANGFTVSVQFGPGNYCDNYDRNIFEEQEQCGEDGSTTAECAVWGRGGQMLDPDDWGDTVSNRTTPDDVLTLMVWAAAQSSEATVPA